MPESAISVEAMPKNTKGDPRGSIPESAALSAGSMLLKPCDALSRKQHQSDMLSEKQQSPEPDPEAVPPILTINEGERIDLKSFLSSEDRDYLVSPLSGEQFHVSCLDGKYVLVCPFLLPYPEYLSFTPNTCQALQSLYAELTRLAIHPIVKLVVVLKLDPSLDHSDFDSFFSRLSLDCLAVPFSDSASAHRICLSLGLPPNSSYDNLYHLAIHPDGTVLQHDHSFLNKYGSLSFPFTDDHFLDIHHLDTRIKLKLRSSEHRLSLNGLLKCNEFSRIASDGSEPVSVSDLAETTVGLYLCIDGRSMSFIQDIHEKCTLQGHKFEIILVPLPFDRHDQAVFCDRMKKSALDNSTSSSWFEYAFNDKVCRSLRRLVECYVDDQLIILPPGTCPGDLYGKQVAFRYGIDAYPFTRDVIVERRFTELRSFTLEFLLGGMYMSDLDLHNKNVVLYIDDSKSYYGFRDYEEIMANYPDTKVVFTLSSPSESGVCNFQYIGWSILRGEVSSAVIERLFSGPGDTCDVPTLVTFGKDGKILSRQAQVRLPRTNNSSTDLFDDKLREEIEYYLTADMRAEPCEDK